MIAGITGEDTPEDVLLFDFENPGRSQDWVIVNDGVMGGLSRGEFVNLGTGSAVFKGTVFPEDIQQLGILVSDKQAGGFRLEIDWIKAYRLSLHNRQHVRCFGQH